MFFGRLTSRGRSLRFRLTLCNALVVVLTAVAVLVALREGLRVALLHEMDQILREDLREVRLALTGPQAIDLADLKQALNRKAEGHAQHGWFIQFLDGEGRELWASVNAPVERLELSTGRPAATPVTIDGFRSIQRPVGVSHRPVASVRIGASLRLIGQDMARIDRLVVASAAVVLVLAPLGGYWLAGRATRPVAAILRTASRLRPAELNERLPIRHTGDELDQLSQTINNLLDRIAEYMQQRREFLANAAHELRSPLAAIRSSVEVALQGACTEEEYESLLAEIIDECQALEILVNQLLLLAETNADQLKTRSERLSLTEIVEKSVRMFEAAAESKGLSLRLAADCEAWVWGSRHHLRQLINNLLDNAIKFTQAGGTIDVALSVDTAQQSVELRVADTGPGISADDLPHIFDRFYRADKSRVRKGATRGTGLGLAICQAVVQAHEGRIEVESCLGHGTTFHVRLPLCSDQSQKPEAPPPPSRSESEGAIPKEPALRRPVNSG